MTEKKDDAGKLEKARIHVTGMTCTTCASTIEKSLTETPGIDKANVNFASEEASVQYDPAKVDLATIKSTISKLGYGAATSEYKGKTYYFCAVGCKNAFDANPEKYLSEFK